MSCVSFFAARIGLHCIVRGCACISMCFSLGLWMQTYFHLMLFVFLLFCKSNSKWCSCTSITSRISITSKQQQYQWPVCMLSALSINYIGCLVCFTLLRSLYLLCLGYAVAKHRSLSTYENIPYVYVRTVFFGCCCVSFISQMYMLYTIPYIYSTLTTHILSPFSISHIVYSLILGSFFVLFKSFVHSRISSAGGALPFFVLFICSFTHSHSSVSLLFCRACI